MPNNESQFDATNENETQQIVSTNIRDEVDGRVETLKPHKVIIWNDNEHSATFVADVLMKVCGKSKDEAVRITMEIHTTGSGVAFTAHKEHAELKREQISTFRDGLAIACGSPNVALNVTIQSD